MSIKPDGQAHGREGHRLANRPALAVVLGLCLSCLLWSMTGFQGIGRSSGSKPRKISEEALDELARSMALRGGSLVVRPPSLGWGADTHWGPRAQTTTRSGKYVITAAAEVQPERLNVLAASLRRFSPATKLVVFVPEASTGADLPTLPGMEVLPFQLPNGTVLEMYRFELYRSYLSALLERDSEAGVLLAGSQDLLVQSDPWQHPLVQRLLDEDALLFTLEGGKAVGDVPLEALPKSQQLMEACFGTAAAEEMAGSPAACAGLTIGGVGAALKYVKQMLLVARGAASPECRLEGGDAVIHNFMLHHLGPAGNLSFAWHVRRNWESPVHATAFGWPVVIDKEGVLSRVEGDTPPLVYQSEQLEGAAQIFRALYPMQPARSSDLRWDGPECAEGAKLDGLQPCPPSKGKESSAAAAGKPKQGSAEREPAADPRKLQPKTAASAGAVHKSGGGAGKGTRRFVR